MSNELKPIPFESLAAKEHEDKIGCIEGTLASLYNAKTGTTKAGNPWSLQDGVLKDGNGNEHRICFAAGQDVSALKGKRIRITSHVGEKGMSGVYMKQDTYTNRAGAEVTTRKIHVTATANIEPVGSSGQPTAAPSTKQPQVTEPAAERPTKPVEPVPSDAPVEIRLDDWFKVYDIVDSMAKARGIDFSVTDKKEITTGAVMSFKGPYATYARVVFAPDAGLQQAKENMEKQLGKSKEVTKQLEEDGKLDSQTETTSGDDKESAFDYEYKGKRLGDYDRAELEGFLASAHKNPKHTFWMSPAGQELRVHLLDIADIWAKEENEIPV